MDRLYIPVIILHLSIVAIKTFYCNDHTITEFGIIDSKDSSTAYVILYELIDTWFFGLEQGGGSLIAPMALAHPLHPIDNRSRNRRRNLWVGWCVSSWWPLFPSGSSVLIYIYVIYICYRTYIYIQQECHSVLVKLHPITFYRTVFLGSAQFLGWMPLFVFFGLPIVSCSLMIIVSYQDACDFCYLF